MTGSAQLQRLLHELEVHQVELEMQNAELRAAREQVETILARYTDLYDFAPIGYLSLSSGGIVTNANLAAAALVGSDRARLPGINFSRFIAPEDQARFRDLMQKVFSGDAHSACDLSLLPGGNGPIVVHVSASVPEGEKGEAQVALFDITDRRLAEDAVRQARQDLERTVGERTRELREANERLVREIEVRRKAEASLQTAYAEIDRLKERLLAENDYLQREVASGYNFGEIIGQDDALSHVFLRVKQVAPMDATVLLLGETGTGKGVIARAIHANSLRKGRPMITVNCTALPANLIESELFGREKGAFTGAAARQIGRFELADGGTIFLDEIGEMPMELQSKLLRVVQEGEFERLGNPRTVKVDVRIIAASNRNLEEEIRNGRFREDLYYRLNVFPIMIPPLRQRVRDIPLLVEHFVAKFNKKIGRKIREVPAATMALLEGYSWPGNVRELESVIERAVITSQGSALQLLDRLDPVPGAGLPPGAEGQAGQDSLALADLEREHILQTLRKTGWRIEGKKGAALLLGLNPSTLRARIRKHGILRP